jgi:hypothetical protein
MIVRQQAFRSFADHPAALRVGKVVSVNRANHTVDIILLAGGKVCCVPVLSGAASTVSGVLNLIAPSVDLDSPSRKTYPKPVSADRILQAPVERTTGDGDPLDPADISYRDIYAVVAPLEGSVQFGLVVVGFLFSPLSEMMFDVGQDEEFSDFSLTRHPSDFQITIDRNGTWSAQHPSGARISIGYENAIAGDGEDPDLHNAGVNLEGKDLNQSYKLRKNKVGPTSVVIVNSEGSHISLNSKRKEIEALHSSGSKLSFKEDSSISVLHKSGTEIVLNEDGSLNIKSGGRVSIDAGMVAVNDASGLGRPIARIGDIVHVQDDEGGTLTGEIVTGSETAVCGG